MRKWRDMERQMEPSSQMFTQGGIRRRDWFSDRLRVAGQAEARVGDTRRKVVRRERRSGGPRWLGEGGQAPPVESITHLDGNQHGQGHGHRLGSLKDLTLHTLKVGVVLSTLHEVSLQGERGGTGIPQKPLGHLPASHPSSTPLLGSALPAGDS